MGLAGYFCLIFSLPPLSCSLSLSLALYHSRSLSLSLTLYHSLSLSISLSLSLSLSCFEEPSQVTNLPGFLVRFVFVLRMMPPHRLSRLPHTNRSALKDDLSCSSSCSSLSSRL